MRYIVGRDENGILHDIPIAGGRNDIVDQGGAAGPHDHDGEYAPVHGHPYSADDHTHAGGGHPDLATHTSLCLSATSHDHSGTYSAAGHNHDAAYAPTHNHPYAGTSHAHPQSDVTNLTTDLGNKAASNHNHDAAYSASGHNHTGTYANASHSHLDADIPAAIARDAEVTSAIATHAATPHGGGGEAFPVGSVFIAVVSTDPATLLGYGTWSAFGAGRVLVGRDAGDTDFDTAEETGGAKTKAISAHSGATVGDHAALSHSAHAGATVGNHAFTQPAAHSDHTNVLNHLHTLATGTGTTGNFSQVIGTVDTSSGGNGATPTQTALGTLSGNPTANGVAAQTHSAHSGGAVDAHSVGQANAHSDHAAQAHTVGQASAHTDLNVVQPYIVCYFWKRTA